MDEAIVLVPGFGASHLWRYEFSAERPVHVWLSQLDVAWGGIGDLDANEPEGAINTGIVRPAAILKEYYQPLYQFMEDRQVPVLEFSYDWRADIATNAQKLLFYLAPFVNGNVKLTVLAHSMGGLIAALALQQVPPDLALKIRRLVTCGTPWTGSFRAVALFTGQHEIVQKIVDLNKIFSRKSRFSWLQEAIRVVASWPGAYDLLPMPEMMTEYGASEAQQFRPGPFFNVVNPWFSQQLATDALARRPIHMAIDERIQHYNWRSVSSQTAGPMPSTWGGRPQFYFESLFGDGTVPQFSSNPGPQMNAIGQDFDAEHDQFLCDPRVLVALGRLMGI
jgi:pimeloyl-ACP methyl ester carboxylesterase